jgi:hypothetical protein
MEMMSSSKRQKKRWASSRSEQIGPTWKSFFVVGLFFKRGLGIDKRREFMKHSSYGSKIVLIICGLLLTSCLLPGMIPLNREPAAPMPTFEKDSDKVIEVLNSNQYVRLEALAQEQYTEEDFSKPGTLTFTAKLEDKTPVYFSYGWCTTTEDILKNNFEHIKVKLIFNEDELGSEVIHPLSFTRPDGLVCLDYGVLMSDWPAGKYKLEAAATFDQRINDGVADYAAGDYVFVYNVTVEEGAATSPTATPNP